MFKDIWYRTRRTYEEMLRNGLLESRINPKDFWNKIKNNKIVHKNIHISRIPSQKFTDKTDDNSFAQTANAFAMLSQHVDAEELEEVITEDEVRHSINTLRTNCSPGRDGICFEMF